MDLPDTPERDVEELLAERGVEVDHVTIYRWVRRFTPLLADAARFCRHAVGDQWFVDETYVKVSGRWRYVYRAVDQYGQVIDVYGSASRDAAAARRFFTRTLAATKVRPAKVVTDRAAVYPTVLEELVGRQYWFHVVRPGGLVLGHAARWYSLTMPPRTLRRRIGPSAGMTLVGSSFGGN